MEKAGDRELRPPNFKTRSKPDTLYRQAAEGSNSPNNRCNSELTLIMTGSES